MYDRFIRSGSATRPRLVLTFTVVVALVLPAVLFIVMQLHDRAHRREHAEQQAILGAVRAAEQTNLVLLGALQAIDRLEETIGQAGWAQVPARRAAVLAEWRRLEQAQPALAGLLAMRPDGRVALVVGPEAAANADLAGLDAARRLKEGQRGPVLDAAPREVSGGAPLLLVGRGRAPEGRPADGGLFALLRAEALAAAWQPHAAPGGSFALLREGGVVLTGSAGAPRGLPPDAPLAAAVEQAAHGLRHGDPFGGRAAMAVAWQRVGTLPLVLLHLVPPAAGPGAVLRDAGFDLAVSLLVGIAFVLFALRMRAGDRQGAETLKRLEANAAELHAEIARREAVEEGLRNARRLEGLGRLTGGVAHDFNNLLTAILGTARSLERHLGPNADERTKRLIAATVAAVDRGARLNASLLAFARRQPLTLATIDANALVRNFLPLLRRALDETMTVELALDPRLPACNADAAQLEAALLNLAINARDAMPKGGTLRIVTRRAWLQEQALAGNADAKPGPYVAIEARDSGQGMSPEVRERAFEPFFTTKAPGQGTGLGLSQVFGFVRQIGGHVAIQSAPGRGTTVTLYLPLGSAAEPSVGGTAAAPRIPAMSGAGCSVLVVEDEPAVRAVAVDMLQDAGFAVLAAPDGPTALALLREGAHVDILFSDVVMPGGMTGVDLAREARRLRPQIGVLLASGYAAEALAQHGGSGEFELIGKPYDSDTVLARLVAQRRQQQQAAPA